MLAAIFEEKKEIGDLPLTNHVRYMYCARSCALVMAMARLNRRVLVSKTLWGGVVFADVIVMLFGAAAERENKSFASFKSCW
jgi:hypothetical protein